VSDGARTRATAAVILARLLAQKGSLSSLLGNKAGRPDQGLIQEICFGVCRYYFPLQAVISDLLEKHLPAKDRDLHCLLLVGAYQIYCLRVPDHAAVNETVQAANLLKKPWARGLVNSLLRKVAANPEVWEEMLASDQEELHYLHPSWLIHRLQNDWPAHWQQILDANNQRPPMTLRVNLARISRSEFLGNLQNRGIQAHAGHLGEAAVYLEKPCQVDELPGFREGLVSVQDEASQLVPEVLGLSAGQRVLDACAAPGGKTSHLLESEPSLTKLVALDIDATRLAGIEENLRRLGLEAEVKQADAACLDAWWDGRPFDRILLDAPCSATGVIRRHPDIKVLRRPEEMASFATRQLSLLVSLWECLAVGGRLLYTTCSLLREENEETVARFLEQRYDAKNQAITADWGVECRFGRQLLPDTQGSDGFYFALLEKSRQRGPGTPGDQGAAGSTRQALQEN